MAHTVQPTDSRAPSPPAPHPWWRTRRAAVAAVVVLLVAAVVAGAILWPSDEVAEEAATDTAADATTEAQATAPLTTAEPSTDAPGTTVTPVEPTVGSGAIAWLPATAAPDGQVLAVTATDTGYLAATHTANGVEFWISDEGDTWTLLVADPAAFRPNYQVYVLHSGPAGFTAEAADPSADMSMGSNLVFASTDGTNWYRSELMGDLPESPSPYLIQHSVVHGVVIGPDSFLAFGSGSLMPDFDLIAAEYAPGYGAADVWAVDAERRPGGGVLIIGFGDDEPLEIPFSELGIEAEDLEMILEEEGAAALSQFLWRSTDGETWESISPQGLPEMWLLPFAMGSVGADDGFYLFSGGPDPNDPEGTGVMTGYHSTDGRTWTSFDLEGPAGDWMHIVNYGQGVFVAVGEDDAGRALWTSTDARFWERAPGSEALFELGFEGDYSIEEIDIGGAGFVAVGHVYLEPEMYPTVPVEPVVVKDGYAVTFGEDGITITNEATGVVEVLDMESGTSETIQVVDDETGLTFVDIASGETLLIVTNEEIETAWDALAEELGATGQPPAQVFRYSTDLATWTLETAEEVFGEGAFAVSGDMNGTTVVAVAATDMARWYEETDRTNLPPTAIWVGRPGD